MAKILIVDDDRGLRQTLRLAFDIRGDQVMEAGSGTEALRIIQAESPDLVILDWQLPGMKGFETCRAIRTSTEDAVRKVPILAVSSLDRRAEAIAAGANEFLKKPFGIDELIDHIATALSAQPGDPNAAG